MEKKAYQIAHKLRLSRGLEALPARLSGPHRVVGLTCVKEKLARTTGPFGRWVCACRDCDREFFDQVWTLGDPHKG